MNHKILVVDDDENQAKLLSEFLNKKGFKAKYASDIGKSLYLYQKGYTLVLLDLKMPEMSGIELMEKMKEIQDGIFILITAHGTIPSAVEAIKKGAFDYLSKPLDMDKLLITIKRAIELVDLRKENIRLKEELKEIGEGRDFVFRSSCMRKIYDTAKEVAETDATCLILGESGTGKEVLARFIHEQSKRKGRFVVVHCGAIPENLLEAELFGYEKGAFTGADKRKEGKVEWADKGTLFLDEIGDMPLSLQGKILRVLQDKSFERVGGLETIVSDVRIITATNQNLKEKIDKKEFREDLYYRLNVVVFELPPLRERKEDIPLLANYFLRKFNKKYSKNITEISERAMEKLLSFSWPGNIRELENVVERAVILCKKAQIDEFPGLNVQEETSSPFSFAMDEMEKTHIEKILKLTGGSLTKAAELLKVHRNTLREKIKKYGIVIKSRIPG